MGDVLVRSVIEAVYLVTSHLTRETMRFFRGLIVDSVRTSIHAKFSFNAPEECFDQPE